MKMLNNGKGDLALDQNNNMQINKWLGFILLLVFLGFVVFTQYIHNPENNFSQLSDEELLIQAEKDNVSAQYQLALKLLNTGVSSDGQRGIQWLHRAAAGGNAEAQYALVINYENIAHTMRDDPVRGMTFLQTAAENSHLRSMAALAEAYEKGLYGWEQDYQKAQHWYQKMIQVYASGDYLGDVDEEFIAVQRRQLNFVNNALSFNKGIVQRNEKATSLDRKIIEINNRYRLQYQKAAKELDDGDQSLEGRKRFRVQVNRLREIYGERREAEIVQLKSQLAAGRN
jgi:Sel1 repeat